VPRRRSRLAPVVGIAILATVIVFLLVRDSGHRWFYDHAIWFLPAAFGFAIAARVVDEVMRARRRRRFRP
jgi:hypothetical protein